MMRLSANKKRLRREAYDTASNNESGNSKGPNGPIVPEASHIAAPGTPSKASPPSVPPSLSGDSKIGGSGCSTFF